MAFAQRSDRDFIYWSRVWVAELPGGIEARGAMLVYVCS